MAQQITVGSGLDIYRVSENSTAWCIADVISVEKDRFEYHIYGWWDAKEHFWMNKSNTKQYAPLHTHTIPCIRYYSVPAVGYNCGRPIYYYSNIEKKSYLVITSDAMEKFYFVWKFDIKNGKYIRFAQYPKSFHGDKNVYGISGISNAIDKKRNLLYIYSYDGPYFASLNLETAQWNIIIDPTTNTLKNKQNIEVPYKNLWYLYSNQTKNTVHLFDDKWRNYRYDQNNNAIIPFSKENITNFGKGDDILFIPYKNTFMMFGGDYYDDEKEIDGDDNILICDIKDDDIFEWKLYNQGNTLLPKKTCRYYSISAFESLVFIFYYWYRHGREIWILNLCDNKWFKSHYRFPDVEIGSMIQTYDNYIHLFDGRERDKERRYHFKISLLDLIPNEMHEHYKQNRYNKLVCGYQRSLAMDIPSPLIMLILNYYPIWLYS